MFLGYLLGAPVGWLAAGTLKFAVNSLRCRRWAFREVGYGGFPSTHATVVATPATVVGIREGIDSPSFAVALALALIVIIDAVDLRRKIGRHAALLNRLSSNSEALRERMGHHPLEILGGLVLGFACGLVLSR